MEIKGLSKTLQPHQIILIYTHAQVGLSPILTFRQCCGSGSKIALHTNTGFNIFITARKSGKKHQKNNFINVAYVSYSTQHFYGTNGSSFFVINRKYVIDIFSSISMICKSRTSALASSINTNIQIYGFNVHCSRNFKF